LAAYLRRDPARQSPSTAVAPVLSVPGPNDAQPIDIDTETSDEAVKCCDVHQWAGPSTGQVNKSPVGVLAPADLLVSWRRWTGIVESFARGRVSRRLADRQAFTRLRNQLLVALRARAAEVHGPERVFFLRLEELVSPWVSAISMAREDPEILRDLLVRCKHAELILSRHSSGFAAVGWFAAASVGLAVVSSLVFWALIIN
jgi:hypothetical protein